MSIIHVRNVTELDEKIEHLLNEKSIVLADELRMTNEVLKKIKTNCQKYYSTESETNQTHHKDIAISKKYKPITYAGFAIFIPLFFISVFSSTGLNSSFIADDDDTVITSLNDDLLVKSMDTRYLVQNLKGDTVDTWNYWDIPSDRSLYVRIIGSNLINSDYYSKLESAIVSVEKMNVNNSLIHKGPKGTESTYYIGWSGALSSISDESLYSIPSLKILSSEDSQLSGDITITLTTQRNPEGLSGITNSLLEGNAILKSYITIYEVDTLSKNQLGTIIRHELGHALGLAHSTDPEDLMFPTITTPLPFISECAVDTITSLYNGNRQSKVVCET